jgi:hypothetical protein
VAMDAMMSVPRAILEGAECDARTGFDAPV